MKLTLKHGHKSDLGYSLIEILTPNIMPELHLCNTEAGLVTIHTDELLKDITHYRKIPTKSELSRIVIDGFSKPV